MPFLTPVTSASSCAKLSETGALDAWSQVRGLFLLIAEERAIGSAQLAGRLGEVEVLAELLEPAELAGGQVHHWGVARTSGCRMPD